MTYLCLDLGTRRIGVAISDPTGTLARPLTTLPGGEGAAGLAERLRPLLQEHAVDEVVVGLPRRLSGAHGPEARQAEELAAGLASALPVPVRLWDERLSTVEAHRLLDEGGRHRGRRRRQVVDRVAAALILQSYLDGGAGREAGA